MNRFPRFLYDPKAQAERPGLSALCGAVGVLIISPLAFHWITGESWAYSITVGVVCSTGIFIVIYRKWHKDEPLPPPPPWLQPGPPDDNDAT